MNIHNQQRQQLHLRLNNAFCGVKLEDGIGLLESLEIDSRSSDKVRSQARDRDEKADWTSIPASALAGTFACFGFLDQKGIRFYLPAFLRAELFAELSEDLVWHLCPMDDWSKDRFGLLSTEQKVVVADVLEWLMQCPGYEGQSSMMWDAIVHFWRVEVVIR